MRAENPILLALIGRGNWGQTYQKTIADLPGVELPEEFIKGRDYQDLLGQLDAFQGVIVASSIKSHLEVARYLLKRDQNLLIEKPVTQEYKQALDLQELHNQHPEAIIMVGHIWLYNPAVIEMKKLIGDDLIGVIRKFRFEGLQSPGRKNATVLQDWGAHSIYLFLDFASKRPKKISAKQLKEDNVLLTLAFPRNIVGEAMIGWTSDIKRRMFSVEGSKGKLTIDYSDGPMRLYHTDSSGQETNYQFPEKPQPLAAEVLHFVECIKTGQVPLTDLAQGVEVVRIIEEAQKKL